MADEEILQLSRAEEILKLLHELQGEELKNALEDYHENDIAEAMGELSPEERDELYDLLGAERFSEVLAYSDDASEVLQEMSVEEAADVLENMDADDAVDVLESLEEEAPEIAEEIIARMDSDAVQDVKLIRSYDDDEIGSMMTTNFVFIENTATVKEAMRSLIRQAEENDNIDTLYVVDKEGKYYGAIELPDLIRARSDTELESIISCSYPSIQATDKINETIDMLRDYAEDSIPVLDEDEKILGVVTTHDIVEMVDAAMSDDYAKLAGLTSEEERNEKLKDSIRKRMPWLALLMVLGLVVSSVIGSFVDVVQSVAIVMCFQSLILDMSGNVGTQSLAVTVRFLMDENTKGWQKFKFFLKEFRTGASNGVVLGAVVMVFIPLYLHFLKAYAWQQSLHVAGCVGISLVIAMAVSSITGTLIPMFFNKIKVDPAVASGPLITTLNDLLASVIYYSLARLLLM